MEGNIAAAYTLIYRFLKQQSQNKAAEAVKKAAKGFVVLRDDVEHEGPPLEDIIKEWKTRRHAKPKDADSSSEESESSDDSSSDSEDGSSSDSSSGDTSGSESEDDDTSDGDDSGDESDEETKGKKSPQKGAERDTSLTLSSVGENAREVTEQATQIPEKESTKDKNKSSESDSSDSNSSDSDSSSKNSASDSSDSETSSGSDSSSSSDSSDEDKVNAYEKALEKALPNTTKTTENKSSSSSDSAESQQKEDAHVAKKRKTSEHGATVTTAVATGSQQTSRSSQKKEKPPPKVRERFQRVKAQNFAPELLLDNGYEARGGKGNDYGERAHRDLIVTRGAGFRKEKSKKKRGSYRGGAITMENHSIKFDF